jgi:hypothetical protein
MPYSCAPKFERENQQPRSHVRLEDSATDSGTLRLEAECFCSGSPACRVDSRPFSASFTSTAKLFCFGHFEAFSGSTTGDPAYQSHPPNRVDTEYLCSQSYSGRTRRPGGPSVSTSRMIPGNAGKRACRGAVVSTGLNPARGT